MRRLQDKVAVITGGARGIGAATAKLFAQEGAGVVIGDVLEAEGWATVQEINDAGGRAWFVPTDVSDEMQAQHLIEEALSKFGRLDILVNNAGVLLGAFTELAEFPSELWERTLAVNLSGAFHCAKHAARYMTTGGVVLFVASGAGVRGGSSSYAYGASKGGVHGLAMTMEAHLRPRGIRVHAVCPSGIATAMKLQNIRESAEHVGRDPDEALAATQPQLGDPLGVARVLLFLASDEGSYVVGTVFTR
ncbi:MAG: SDR family oxidoreductase [Abditibacteriales bacterium]|nr:SDR family oxidoreductase [Abditibacteriales bacterium]MDW8365358.1 SDR family oxidoreductase [Abditibacteriales bacterium]